MSINDMTIGQEKELAAIEVIPCTDDAMKPFEDFEESYDYGCSNGSSNGDGYGDGSGSGYGNGYGSGDG